MTKQSADVFFQQNDEQASTAKPTHLDSVSWTISDGPTRQFSAKWYILITLTFTILIALAIWLMQSILTAVLFGLIFVALIIYTRRPAQDITYRLNDDGLFINDQLYTFDKFSSFGIIENNKNYTIIMLPSKKLATSLTINFDRVNGEKIVDFLGAILPMRQVQENLIDKIIRQLGL
ncbi:MAG: hypothetical protein Q3996_00555 [Candidatus Saccharibacteria bacterium]|nr:hypothetical protein [Candidatus Saccharibacteria bacterium]